MYHIEVVCDAISGSANLHLDSDILAMIRMEIS